MQEPPLESLIFKVVQEKGVATFLDLRKALPHRFNGGAACCNDAINIYFWENMDDFFVGVLCEMVKFKYIKIVPVSMDKYKEADDEINFMVAKTLTIDSGGVPEFYPVGFQEHFDSTKKKEVSTFRANVRPKYISL